MKGIYTLESNQHCKAVTRRVDVVRWLGDRVLLRELERPEMLIDTPLDAFQPDLEKVIAKAKGGAK